MLECTGLNRPEPSGTVLVRTMSYYPALLPQTRTYNDYWEQVGGRAQTMVYLDRESLIQFLSAVTLTILSLLKFVASLKIRVAYFQNTLDTFPVTIIICGHNAVDTNVQKCNDECIGAQMECIHTCSYRHD